MNDKLCQFRSMLFIAQGCGFMSYSGYFFDIFILLIYTVHYYTSLQRIKSFLHRVKSYGVIIDRYKVALMPVIFIGIIFLLYTKNLMVLVA